MSLPTCTEPLTVCDDGKLLTLTVGVLAIFTSGVPLRVIVGVLTTLTLGVLTTLTLDVGGPEAFAVEEGKQQASKSTVAVRVMYRLFIFVIVVEDGLFDRFYWIQVAMSSA